MKNKTKIVIGIIVTAIAIPFGIYTISPLFINTEINEPFPLLSSESSISFEKFMAMTEDEKIKAAKNMTVEEKDMILRTAAAEQRRLPEEGRPAEKTGSGTAEARPAKAGSTETRSAEGRSTATATTTPRIFR